MGHSGIMDTMSEMKRNYKQGKINARSMKAKELVRLEQRMRDDMARVTKLRADVEDINRVIANIESLEIAKEACQARIDEVKGQAKVSGDMDSVVEITKSMNERMSEIDAQIRLAYYGRS